MVSWQEWMNGFFFWENCIWSPFFLFVKTWFSLDISGETISWITLLDGLLRLFFCWWRIDTSSWLSATRMLVHFVMTYVLQQQYFYYFKWSTNQLPILENFFYFSSDFLLIKLISLCFDYLIFFHVLAS